MSKINWPQAVLGMCFIACATAVIRPSVFDEPVTVTETKTLPPKVITKTKVVEKRVVVPTNKRPDGYMSKNDCFAVPKDMKVEEVMYRFGWPAGKDGRAMGLGDAKYPIREDHGASCTVLFPYGTVSTVIYRTDNQDYGGTETWGDTN
jgi:hypothetical protein